MKQFTEAQIARSKEISAFIFEKENKTDIWGRECYESEELEDGVVTYQFPQNMVYKSTTVSVSKMHLVNVKTGKHVPGSNYFVVDDDGDVIDENYIGYKTLGDAKRAMEIYVDEKNAAIKRWEEKEKV